MRAVDVEGKPLNVVGAHTSRIGHFKSDAAACRYSRKACEIAGIGVTSAKDAGILLNEPLPQLFDVRSVRVGGLSWRQLMFLRV